MLKKIIKTLITTIFTLLILMPINVNATTFIDNQTVDANKTWTICFNQDILFDDLTKQSITVADSKGNIVNISLSLGKDNKTILVNAPTNGYIPGEKYTLNIGTSVHSLNNGNLTEPFRMNFNINNNDLIKDLKIEKYNNIDYVNMVSVWNKYSNYSYNNKDYFFQNQVKEDNQGNHLFQFGYYDAQRDRYILCKDIPMKVIDKDYYFPLDYYINNIYPLIKNNEAGTIG